MVMKITQSQLRKIIREELTALVEGEEPSAWHAIFAKHRGKHPLDAFLIQVRNVVKQQDTSIGDIKNEGEAEILRVATIAKKQLSR